MAVMLDFRFWCFETAEVPKYINLAGKAICETFGQKFTNHLETSLETKDNSRKVGQNSKMQTILCGTRP